MRKYLIKNYIKALKELQEREKINAVTSEVQDIVNEVSKFKT